VAPACADIFLLLLHLLLLLLLLVLLLVLLLQALRNRFVTGDWDAAAVRSAARPADDDGLSEEGEGEEEGTFVAPQGGMGGNCVVL
jgi:hypothetical protein